MRRFRIRSGHWKSRTQQRLTHCPVEDTFGHLVDNAGIARAAIGMHRKLYGDAALNEPSPRLSRVERIVCLERMAALAFQLIPHRVIIDVGHQTLAHACRPKRVRVSSATFSEPGARSERN